MPSTTDRIAKPIQSPIGQTTHSSAEGHVVTQDATTTGQSTNSSSSVLQQLVDSLQDLLDHRTDIRSGVQGVNGKQWNMSGEAIAPTDGHPLINVAIDALGIDRTAAQQDYDILSGIIERVVNLIGSDRPDDVFRYISGALRRSPGSSLRTFSRYIEMLSKEMGGE